MLRTVHSQPLDRLARGGFHALRGAIPLHCSHHAGAASANRIQGSSTVNVYPIRLIESHIFGWLELHYEPEGLNEQQMEKFESLIDAWILDYQHSQRVPEHL